MSSAVDQAPCASLVTVRSTFHAVVPFFRTYTVTAVCGRAVPVSGTAAAAWSGGVAGSAGFAAASVVTACAVVRTRTVDSPVFVSLRAENTKSVLARQTMLQFPAPSTCTCRVVWVALTLYGLM